VLVLNPKLSTVIVGEHFSPTNYFNNFFQQKIQVATILGCKNYWAKCYRYSHCSCNCCTQQSIKL